MLRLHQLTMGNTLGAYEPQHPNVLLGHRIDVYTDHKNLVHKHFNTERVMCAMEATLD